MIRVTLLKNAGEFTGFECKGHAGYAEAGSDIVCAAVSILTTTCVNALESVAGIEAEIQVEDGLMKAYLPENAGHDAQVIFGFLRQGLRDIADEYPRYLQLTEKKIIGGSKQC